MRKKEPYERRRLNCWSCGGEHLRRDCNKKKTTTLKTMSILKSKSPRFIAKINDVEFNVLVDSGATLNFISESLANKLDLKIHLCTKEIRLGKGSCQSTGEVSLKIEDLRGKYSETISALVVPELEENFIIGYETMTKLKMRIDAEKDEIRIFGNERIQNESMKMICEVERENFKCLVENKKDEIPVPNFGPLVNFNIKASKLLERHEVEMAKDGQQLLDIEHEIHLTENAKPTIKNRIKPHGRRRKL
jgi:predicted aspartyl protease